VHGSLIFRQSVLLGPAIFDTVALSGELSVRESAFSYFLLQFSSVGGVLDLTKNRAHCAYNIRTSEIGDFVAVGAGFDSVAHPTDQRNVIDAPFDWRLSVTWWYLVKGARIQAMIDYNKAHKKIDMKTVQKTDIETEMNTEWVCNNGSIAPQERQAFLVSDARIRSSLCFRSFAWNGIRPSDRPAAILSFKDLNVRTTTFIDLPPFDEGAADPSDQATEPARSFEALGLETNSLIFNFSKATHTYRTSVNGLKFNHVYAIPGEPCAYDPDIATPKDLAKSHLKDTDTSKSQLRFPPVGEVTTWLNRNFVQTTQPFSAFVDAFQKDGEDDAAKTLRIEKATTELCVKARRVFLKAIVPFCNGIAPKTVTSSTEPQEETSLFQRAYDKVATTLGLALWVLADHGYRPEKVVGWVLLIILISILYSPLVVQVVAVKSAKRDIIRPIGLAFLFDRLLPAYHIREEHYDIESYYKLAAMARRQTRYATAPIEIQYLEYLWLKIPVVKADKTDVRHVEIFLDVLKVIGIVLAIFLVAAINALVTH
jgi:hypothetical protein